MIVDNWLTKQDFIRITDTGPESLVEAMWFYLYVHGIKKVPLSWEMSRFAVAVGKPVMTIIRKIIQSNNLRRWYHFLTQSVHQS